MGVRHGAHQNLTEPKRVLTGSTLHAHHNHHPGPALPGGRNQLRARNAAIAALGIVSAVMVAAGAAIGGGMPTPSHTPAAPAEHTSQPRAPARAQRSDQERRQVIETPSYQLHGRPGTGPVPEVPAVIAGLAAPA